VKNGVAHVAHPQSHFPGLALFRKFGSFSSVHTKVVKECFPLSYNVRTSEWGAQMYRLPETVRTTHGKDGAVVLDIKQGRVIRLNTTASYIIQCIERGETESQIVDGIVRDFRIARDLAHSDIAEFLKSMEREGLVDAGPPTIRQ
jgi:Coenzyme PQQ synthesis protein D (PqqD)